MKALIACSALVLAIAGMSSAADAKGCLKGAAVGGVAGHMAGRHGVLGAAAGCAIGHHQANKAQNQNPQAQQPQQRSTTGSK